MSPLSPLAEHAPGTPGTSVDTTDRPGCIKQAVLELVAEVGYERMTMDAIASRAKASKATIYRRWGSKAELVADALQCRAHSDLPAPDTGSLRGDLIEGLSHLVDHLSGEDVDLAVGLMGAMRSDPELGALMRSQVFAAKKVAARVWFDAAVARGELPADADIDLAHEIAMSLVFQRIAMFGEAVDDAYVAHVVDDVLLPVLTRTQGSSSSS